MQLNYSQFGALVEKKLYTTFHLISCVQFLHLEDIRCRRGGGLIFTD